MPPTGHSNNGNGVHSEFLFSMMDDKEDKYFEPHTIPGENSKENWRGFSIKKTATDIIFRFTSCINQVYDSNREFPDEYKTILIEAIKNILITNVNAIHEYKFHSKL